MTGKGLAGRRASTERSFLPWGALFVLLALWCAACGSESEPTLRTSTPSGAMQLLRDPTGRALVLHGLNVSGSAKDDPQRMPWVERTDLQRMRREWGLNAIRLLIFWDAIEPEPGQFQAEYLERVAERVAWCADAGLWVVLDMHQDVYGKRSADGKPLGFDGAPAWAARTDGLPHVYMDPWALTYFQPGVRRAFDHFWSGSGVHADLQEHYRLAWKFVAQRFASHPAVLGYDLMNEPFAGSAAAGTFGNLRIGDSERGRLFEETTFTQATQGWIDAIRSVDPEKWIFYEPLAFPANNGGPVYLKRLRDPRPGESRLVYAPHFYALAPEINNHFDPSATEEMDVWAQERKADQERFGHPLLIGEVGLPWNGGGRPLEYLEKFFDLADSMSSGWMYWSYDPGSWGPVQGANREETPLVSVFVRVYPLAVNGDVLAYRFDRATRRFSLHYVARPRTGSNTEIAVPARLYPEGFRVNGCSGTCRARWDETTQVLSITGVRAGEEVAIEVVPWS